MKQQLNAILAVVAILLVAMPIATAEDVSCGGEGYVEQNACTHQAFCALVPGPIINLPNATKTATSICSPITIASSDVLPIAGTASVTGTNTATLGGVKVGPFLQRAADGTISVDTGTGTNKAVTGADERLTNTRSSTATGTYVCSTGMRCLTGTGTGTATSTWTDTVTSWTADRNVVIQSTATATNTNSLTGTNGVVFETSTYTSSNTYVATNTATNTVTVTGTVTGTYDLIGAGTSSATTTLTAATSRTVTGTTTTTGTFSSTATAGTMTMTETNTYTEATTRTATGTATGSHTSGVTGTVSALLTVSGTRTITWIATATNGARTNISVTLYKTNTGSGTQSLTYSFTGTITATGTRTWTTLAATATATTSATGAVTVTSTSTAAATETLTGTATSLTAAVGLNPTIGLRKLVVPEETADSAGRFGMMEANGSALKVGYLSRNLYLNGGVWTYRAAGNGTVLSFGNTSVSAYYAVSGTAGAGATMLPLLTMGYDIVQAHGAFDGSNLTAAGHALIDLQQPTAPCGEGQALTTLSPGVTSCIDVGGEGSLTKPVAVCAAGEVLTSYTDGVTTCVSNGAGGTIACAGGSCTSYRGVMFSNSTSIVNAPLAYSGNDAYFDGLVSASIVVGANIDNAGNTTGHGDSDLRKPSSPCATGYVLTSEVAGQTSCVANGTGGGGLGGTGTAGSWAAWSNSTTLGNAPYVPVSPNNAIAPASTYKAVTYDAKGLVTGGQDITPANIGAIPIGGAVSISYSGTLASSGATAYPGSWYDLMSAMASWSTDSAVLLLDAVATGGSGSGSTSQCGIRILVDGSQVGSPAWIDPYVVGSKYTMTTSARVAISSGNHTLKVQASAEGSTGAVCAFNSGIDYGSLRIVAFQ
jgi:hypothetical protein